jgi:hypothetical protein
MRAGRVRVLESSDAHDRRHAVVVRAAVAAVRLRA